MSAGISATGTLSDTGEALIYATSVETSADSSAALRIDANAFATRYIQQALSKPATENTLRVTLRPNFVVPPSTILSIFNLRGAIPMGNGATVQLTPSSVPFGHAAAIGTGTWLTKEEGVLLYAREALVAGNDYVFSFMVKNPTDGQDSPSVSLQTRIPFIGPQVLTLDGGGSAAVLSADNEMFIEAGIRQSSCFPGATNTITADFRLNFDVTHREHDLSQLVLAISGLRSPNGSYFPRGAIPVETAWSATSSVNAELQFKRMGQWHEHRGLMELRPSTRATGILSDVTYSVSWNVHNSFRAQDPPAPSGVSIRLFYDGPSSWNVSKVMTMSNEALAFTGSIPGDAAPLRVYEPRFISISAAQSSPWPRAENTITLTFVASVNISYQSSVTISGLTGTDTTQACAVCAPKVNFGTHQDLPADELPFSTDGQWNQQSGTLILNTKNCRDESGAGTTFQPRSCYMLPAGIHQVNMCRFWL